MRALALGIREFRANLRRNAIFGAILLIAVTTQMVTALSDTASRAAITNYGTAAFGYAQTYSAALSKPITGSRLVTLNAQLDRLRHNYPWFQPATATDLSVTILTRSSPDPQTGWQLTLRAVSPGWRTLSPALADDDSWRTLTSQRRLGPAVILESQTARQLAIGSGDVISIIRSPAGGGPASSAGPSGLSPDALTGVPMLGVYTELNKSLSVSGLVSQNLVTQLAAGPQSTSIYWRCEPVRCPDAAGLAQAATTSIGGQLSSPVRIDQLDQFAPVLNQQQRDGQRMALIVLLLGALAVAVVSTAFVEVRAPQFATLRTLGASRSTIAGICLLENVLTAAVVALLAVLIGAATTQVSPNLFNRIPQIRLEHLDTPLGLYLRIVLLTLLVGLLTGLFPALRAYRAVRTN